jgi:putative tryptophan/tyrosine transport system substrate-binding protein
MQLDQLKRREFISLLGGAAVAWPLAARAQQAGKIPRVGFMGNSTAALEANLVGPFRDGLRELGYQEGRNIVIEYRWAEGNYERFPALVAELLAVPVDVIVTAGTPATLAVKKATSTVPLVMIAVGDPVGTGVVRSLARPGGNVTGLSSIAPDLEGKRLELLRDVIPKLSHVALFLNPLNPFHTVSMRQAFAAAQALGIKLQPLEVRTSGELDPAFAAIVREKPDALLILADRVFLHDRKRMMDFATEHRLPSVNAYREVVEAGGLMSYGPSYEDMHRRAADYVDKILKGAKPADLPVEQPTALPLVAPWTSSQGWVIGPSSSSGERRCEREGSSRPPRFPARPRANAGRLGPRHSHLRSKFRKRALECGFPGSDPSEKSC